MGEEDDIQDWHEEGKIMMTMIMMTMAAVTHCGDPTSVSNLAGPLVAIVGALLLGLLLA